jgi:hypothetical protein
LFDWLLIILDVEKLHINMDEEVSIPKYELIMVLKENEALRKKNTSHQNIIDKMNQKMGMFKIVTFRKC